MTPDSVPSSFTPICAQCSNLCAIIVLQESDEGTRLIYSGPGGSNGTTGDLIAPQRAAAIRAAFTPPHAHATIRAAGFYDDAGFCVLCGKFYCAAHWNITDGGGTCPAGHLKPLDPHWSPE